MAFTFSADDGNRPDDLAWAGVFVPCGLRFTVFIPSSWVDWIERDKLTSADLRDLHRAGIEIGSHGKTHVRLTEVDDAQLRDELLGSCRDLEAVIGGDYLCRTIAYPEHAHDHHVMVMVDFMGFTGARDGGSSPAGPPDFSLGQSTWAETNLFELPLTVTASFLVGPGNSYSETQTRNQVQQLLGGKISSQNYWVNVYAHTLNDLDVQHMSWIVDELLQSDVWIANFASVADYYRLGHGMFVPVGVAPRAIGVEPGDPRGPVPGGAYPNPFQAGALTIPFTLPRSGKVTIRILGPSGGNVRTLVDGVMVAGDQSARWDGLDDHGASVPSGIYFYEILTPASRTTRKLVRLR